MSREDVRDFFNRTAGSRGKWKKRNSFYHKSLQRYFSFIIPEESRVLEVGCGLGDLLAFVKPAYGVGVDFSEATIEIARTRYPDLIFHVQDAESLSLNETFDYIILSDLACSLWDAQKALECVFRHCNKHTRLIISNFNYLWQPVMLMAEALHLKLPQPRQNWLSTADINNLLQLSGFRIITVQHKLMFPKNIPVINQLFNRILANLPLLDRLDLVNLIVARPVWKDEREYSVSIIIPARNERGNIENVILRTPSFGSSREFIFVEGHSSDQTYEEMIRVKKDFPGKDIKVMKQSQKGKGNAVREGFDIASGEILMILDADLSVPPEELEKFYMALKTGRGEFINGCRLVYPMEKDAMRFLNLLANKLYGLFFTYLLGQRLKDTLCGTKVLFKRDYEAIKRNRSFFGEFDPFGDFDLLFGSSKLQLEITEIIVRYRERVYGSTQISRFKHGWLLLKMSMFAARKVKFR